MGCHRFPRADFVDAICQCSFKSASFKDFLPPTFKTCVYGLIIGTISTFQGMRTKGGAAGVGDAATTSVVLSSLFVILADVILVKVILLLFP